jgi:hypothetical protein
LISGLGAGAGVGTTGATNWVSLSFVDLGDVDFGNYVDKESTYVAVFGI